MTASGSWGRTRLLALEKLCENKFLLVLHSIHVYASALNCRAAKGLKFTILTKSCSSESSAPVSANHHLQYHEESFFLDFD
jgi:hypothetical protein